MKKFIAAIALVGMLGMPMAGAAGAKNGNAPGHANETGTVQGVAEDANAPALGEVKYLFNKPGYHFWFTAIADLGFHVAENGYHNIYKYSVEDTSNWCGLVSIPDRAPYNAGGTAGGTAYYKIWNVTTEMWVCGSD